MGETNTVPLFCRYAGRSIAELIEHIRDQKIIASNEVAKTMYDVDRSKFGMTIAMRIVQK